MAFEQLQLFSLNNRSKICSTLLSSKSKPFAGPCCFTHLQDTGFAPESILRQPPLVFPRVFSVFFVDQGYLALELVLVYVLVALLI
jgi:hypothetical protein